jgi:CO dehydrogenase maturation factor
MSLRIAIAGKGGVGKTSLSSLICGSLMKLGARPLLAVDADPNSCLAERLGITVDRTIGQLREELRRQPDKIPQGISKSEWIERLISEEVAEAIGFDIIVMGRQEGPDCYCYINNLLRNCLNRLGEQYRAVVIDNEAGLEHLSRRTNGKVEVMLVVCEPTMLGARTAARIRDIIRSLELDIDKTYLVLNRCRGEIPADVKEQMDATGMEIIGRIPDDPLLTQFELERRSLLEMPEDGPAAAAVRGFLQQMMDRRNQ